MAVEQGFDEVLRILTRHQVEFVLVGGIAAILQGSPLTTEDIDIVYRDSEPNHGRLAKALSQMDALYFDPAGRRIEPDVSKLASLRMHLLKTRYGRVDLLKSIGDNLRFEDLLAHTCELEVAELRIRTLLLDKIIETKEHADRPKDRYQLAFLKQLRAELSESDS